MKTEEKYLVNELYSLQRLRKQVNYKSQDNIKCCHTCIYNYYDDENEILCQNKEVKEAVNDTYVPVDVTGICKYYKKG